MDDARDLIDPQGLYPADGPRIVERHAAKFLELLPGAHMERTRDVIQIDHGGQEGIVVVVTPEDIEFRLPTVEWTMGAYGPCESSRLWKRVGTDELDDEMLPDLIRRAKQARKRQYRKCRHCGRRVPTEHRYSADVCHACASEHEGVVF